MAQYTPEQVKAINIQREQRYAAGLSPYTGALVNPEMAAFHAGGGVIGTPQIPTTEIDISKLSAKTPEAFNQAVLGILNKAGAITFESETQRKQWEEIQKSVSEQQKGWFQKQLEMISARPKLDMEVKQKALQEQYGIPEYYKEIQKLTPEIIGLQNRLVTLQQRESAGMMALEQQPIGLPAIVGEQVTFQKNIAVERAGLSAELGAKAAIAEMYRGNITLARSLISDTTQALIYDYNQKIADWDLTYDLYGDYFKTLDNTTQKALDRSYTELTKQRDKAEADIKQNLTWYIDAVSKKAPLSWTMQQIKTLPPIEAGRQYAKAMAQVPEKGVIVPGEEPAPNMRSMVQRYLTAPPEEQERYIPSAPYQQADFWTEVDWLMSQQPEIGRPQIEAEFFGDKQGGMPLESAITLYGKDLGENWIREQYKTEITPKGKPWWQKAVEWTTLPFTYPYQQLFKK